MAVGFRRKDINNVIEYYEQRDDLFMMGRAIYYISRAASKYWGFKVKALADETPVDMWWW